MSDNTPRLQLPELVAGQAQMSVTHNEALVQIDALSDVYLLDQFVNTPPGSPADGDSWLVGGAPTGLWSGYAYKIAYCIDGGWRFYTPFNGLRAFVAATNAFIVYQSGQWLDANALLSANEVSVASAATCDLGAAGSLVVAIAGTTGITSFGTGAHLMRFVRFAGALTLTHNATSLILLGGASRVTAAGDSGLYMSDGSGNWRERAYVRAASDPGDAATKSGAETLTNKTLSGATLSGTTLLPGSGSISSGGKLTTAGIVSNAAITAAPATSGVYAGTASSHGYWAMTDGGAATDGKLWDWLASGTNLLCRLTNDAISSSVNWLTVVRSGTAFVSATFGGLLATTGLLDLSASGAGQIKFPATANLSSNVNTLDDYEEGTFTPTYAASTGTYTPTYGTQVGWYRKIGGLVAFGGVVSTTAFTGTPTGRMSIGGLPFTSKSTANAGISVVGQLMDSSIAHLIADMTVSGTSINLFKFTSGTASDIGAVFTQTQTINFGGCYTTDS